MCTRAAQGTQDDIVAKRTSQTVEFNFNPEDDTADDIAADLGNEFNLSPTDRRAPAPPPLSPRGRSIWMACGGNIPALAISNQELKEVSVAPACVEA